MTAEAREAADAAGEVLGEEFKPDVNPSNAVRDALAAEKSPPDAAGNAVVATRDCDIRQLPPDLPP